MRKGFLKWVRTCANTVGLSDWDIEVIRGDLPDDTFARINVPRARQTARISLGEAYFASTPEEKRATLVHELLHCHFAPITEIVEESLPVLLGKPAYTAFETAHDLATERCLEAIAVSIANLLPVPPPEGE